MNRKLKRGQAAMEFLMTYGWAILAAIIAIGVLAYFGVFTPGKYIGGSAAVTAPFYVNAWNVRAGTNGVITLEIRNNGGEFFEITNVGITNCGSNTTGLPINADSVNVTTVTCGGALSEGDNFKGDITLTYRKEGSSVDLTSTGTIAQKIVA